MRDGLQKRRLTERVSSRKQRKVTFYKRTMNKGTSAEYQQNKRKTMTKLQIISKLWSAIYDLIFLVKGTPTKSLEEIEKDLDIAENSCRIYADVDDDEIE